MTKLRSIWPQKLRKVWDRPAQAAGLSYALLSSLPVIANTDSFQDPAEAFKVIGIHLEGRLDNDPRSGYNRLIEALLPQEVYQSQYQRYPFVRAIRDFRVLPNTCMFPTSRNAIEYLYRDVQFATIDSVPIDRVSAHIISAPDKPTFNTLEELKGAKIAVQHAVGVPQLQALNLDVDIWRVPHDYTALKMILAGRAVAMYGWFPDIFIIAENHGLALPHFNPDFILYQTTTHVTCKTFKGHEALIETVNERIAELKQNGQMREILGQYARIIGEPKSTSK